MDNNVGSLIAPEPTVPGERMSSTLSLYLDLTRAAVALVVLLSHCWLVLFPSYPLHWPGPAAVIVFFVLSGFVIAYVTDGHDRTLGQYALNRLSRLWSVALPALAFGLLVSHFVGTSVLAPKSADGAALFRTAANALFLGQSWFLDLSPPFNGPFWSLNYEAWFYAIFGAWVYLPRRIGMSAALLLTIAAGPKIVLMLPCSLLGVFALPHYRPLEIVRTRSRGFVGKQSRCRGSPD